MKSLLLTLLMACLPMAAQPPRNMFAWWDSPIASDLNLTADQQQQIRQVVKEYRVKLIDQRAAAEKAEADLEDQFNEDNTDARRATEAIDRLANARADLTRSFAQMSLRLRGVLTPEQWRTLQSRSFKMRERPGGMPGMRRQMPQGQRPTPPQE